MSKNTVNGEKICDPLGIDALENFREKKIINRSTIVTHGREERGFDAKAHQKISIDGLLEQVKQWKENGRPLEDVMIMRAENNQEIQR